MGKRGCQAGFRGSLRSLCQPLGRSEGRGPFAFLSSPQIGGRRVDSRLRDRLSVYPSVCRDSACPEIGIRASRRPGNPRGIVNPLISEGSMSKTSTVGLRIAGSVVGLLVGGVLVFLVLCRVVAVAGDVTTSDPSLGSFVLSPFGSPAALPGVIFGAVEAAMPNTVSVGIAVSARRQQVGGTDSIPLESVH